MEMFHSEWYNVIPDMMWSTAVQPHHPDGVWPFIDLWYRELLLPVQVTDAKKTMDSENFILFISVHKYHYIK
jgi:hypothetical protein